MCDDPHNIFSTLRSTYRTCLMTFSGYDKHCPSGKWTETLDSSRWLGTMPHRADVADKWREASEWVNKQTNKQTIYMPESFRMCAQDSKFHLLLLAFERPLHLAVPSEGTSLRWKCTTQARQAVQQSWAGCCLLWAAGTCQPCWLPERVNSWGIRHKLEEWRWLHPPSSSSFPYLNDQWWLLSFYLFKPRLNKRHPGAQYPVTVLRMLCSFLASTVTLCYLFYHLLFPSGNMLWNSFPHDNTGFWQFLLYC